jgi:glycosyltransferase involved in cell wall biosynthesis
MARISVLLPNYNNAPYLKEALDSLFAQTFQDFIIYFIDDCSTDGSVAIAESYQDERLIIIRKKQNSGIVDTMNIGLNLINTEYYIRMDGDDISTPKRFEILLKFMDQHPEIGVCSSSIQTFGIENDVWSYESKPLQNKANLIFGHSIGHASSIFRTIDIKGNNIQYQDDFWRMEDYWLFYNLKNLTKTTSIPDILYLYRRGTNNVNAEITNKKIGVRRLFYEQVLDDLKIIPSITNVDLHMQLAGHLPVNYTIKEYSNYIDILIKANQQEKIYPIKELNTTLKKAKKKLIFKSIDNNSIKFREIAPYFISFPATLRYYLAAKIKSINN